jgi:hypothetical protein
MMFRIANALLALCLSCTLASAEDKKTSPKPMLKVPPAVFAVGEEYQILVLAPDTLVRLRIGDQFYSDHINGVRPSRKSVHRFRIPMPVLDRAGKYEVFCRKLPKRLPYMHQTTPEPESSSRYDFRKIPEKDIRIYHLSDTHDRFEAPIRAAQASGRIDLLVLNGDITDKMVNAEQLEYPCILAGRISGGSIPVIYTRGNHELRGEFAEFVQDYTPNRDGKLYYTVRLGPIWALVLDCGEDKVDELPVYGFAIDCARHRQEVLAYMNRVLDEGGFKAAGIKYKMVICHVPFSALIARKKEDELLRRRFMIYGEWCKLLRTRLMPDLTLCGHMHQTQILRSNSYPFPVIVGSRPGREQKFTGTSIELMEKTAVVKFSDQDGQVESETAIPLKKP